MNVLKKKPNFVRFDIPYNNVRNVDNAITIYSATIYSCIYVALWANNGHVVFDIVQRISLYLENLKNIMRYVILTKY